MTKSVAKDMNTRVDTDESEYHGFRMVKLVVWPKDEHSTMKNSYALSMRRFR